MAKSWNGTPEQFAVLREIRKHPIGTEPGIIYKHFDSQTWEVLRRANRIDGEVFQMIWRMVKEPTILEKVMELKEPGEITPELSINLQTEVDHIIEDAIISLNLEIQKAIEDISQKVFNKVKIELSDIPFND